jgi:hypothetical protein
MNGDHIYHGSGDRKNWTLPSEFGRPDRIELNILLWTYLSLKSVVDIQQKKLEYEVEQKNLSLTGDDRVPVIILEVFKVEI